VDEVTRGIVEALTANARTSFSAIGRRVHLSTPAVIARVKRLEEDGVILGYRTDVDWAQLGRPVAMYALLKCTRHGERRFRQQLSELPEILSCRLVTGEWSFVIFAAAESIEGMHEFLERLGQFGETSSGAVLENLDLLPAAGTPADHVNDT
jgi:Lrp/AsnC family transcriptional regulator, leucine-responsive regulatory protein